MAVILFAFFLPAINVSAQAKKQPNPSYKTAIGAKIFPLALSIKSMSSRKSAFEFLGYFKDGFRITGLFERHGVINQEGNLKWYIGGGGHVGFSDKVHGNDAKLGVDGVIGLDYKFLNMPLNLSLDWQPSFGFGDKSSFTANWGGIGVRYCF